LEQEILMIAVYLRCSTSKQETAAQRHAVEAWCHQQGYDRVEIVEHIDEAVSGSTLARPGFRHMMADVRTGKINKIVTFEISRLSRNFLDSLTVMKTLADYGVMVEVPGEGIQPFDTTMQQFVVAAKGLVAAQERERISERTKAGLAAAKARGSKLGRPKNTMNTNAKNGWRKEYDASLVEKILMLSRKGNSTHTIASAVGLSQNMVFRILRRYVGA
jgi:DNA invertase Pin-like site-specific DNA recombinase